VAAGRLALARVARLCAQWVVRILFIEVDTERSWAVASIGPSFIAAYLREHGHEVGFFRAALGASIEDVVARVEDHAPELIGVSLTTRQWQRARFLIRELRGRVDVPVVAGGLHATFSPEVVLDNPGFDFVCLGEGEEPMLDLVGALESGADPARIDGIANIWARGGKRPALRRPFEPIDALPFMARDLLDEPPGVIHMATQRGCPFPCTYCAARMYNQLYKDTAEYGRRRSHQSVLDELFALERQSKLAYVIFLDDTFTIHHPWVKEFCRVYGQALRTPFSLHARVETVNERLLHMLAAAGCSQITYGVESGSERIRRQVMHRPVKNERFRDVFRWTREAGIAVTANYMLGLPGETREDLQQTLDLAEELEVLDFGYFVFYPYPGTQLFHECLQKGYLPADYLDRPANHRQSILDLPGLTQDDIAACYDRFTALRRRLYLERHGVLPDQQDSPGATDHVFDLARTG
jgi:anaerobic magnesium-protoporphyrin IX monomethyl ester cyclase